MDNLKKCNSCRAYVLTHLTGGGNAHFSKQLFEPFIHFKDNNHYSNSLHQKHAKQQ